MTRVTNGSSCLRQPAGIETWSGQAPAEHQGVITQKSLGGQMSFSQFHQDTSRPSPSPAKALGCAMASSCHARNQSLCTISPSTAMTGTQRFLGLRELPNWDPKGTISAMLQSGKLPRGTQAIPTTRLLPVYRCPALLMCPRASLCLSPVQTSTLPEDNKSSAGGVTLAWGP